MCQMGGKEEGRVRVQRPRWVSSDSTRMFSGAGGPHTGDFSLVNKPQSTNLWSLPSFLQLGAVQICPSSDAWHNFLLIRSNHWPDTTRYMLCQCQEMNSIPSLLSRTHFADENFTDLPFELLGRKCLCAESVSCLSSQSRWRTKLTLPRDSF